MKLHTFLFVVCAVSTFKVIGGRESNTEEAAVQWLILCGVALISFLGGCFAKAHHDDKLAGRTDTRDAFILYGLFLLITKFPYIVFATGAIVYLAFEYFTK